MLPEPLEKGEGVLFRLSDSSGEMTMDEVGRGEVRGAPPFCLYFCVSLRP